MTAEEAEYERKNASRTPTQVCANNSAINDILVSMMNGAFSDGDNEIFMLLVDSLMDRHDPYLLILDL